MADSEEVGGRNMNLDTDPGDVFVNGESDTSKANSLLHPDYGSLPEQLLPRRSSIIRDASRRGQRKKTVSFSSMPNEKSVINAPDCVNYMQGGSELIKVRSNSRQYHRLFTLDDHLSEIRWQPSSKKPHKARIPLDQIKEVRVGKNTDILRNRDIAGSYPDECAFSVIYGDSFDTMDLIANTPDEANIWVTGLTCLISGKNRSPEEMVERQDLRDKWLQEEFETADHDHSGLIDEYEVVQLMKKLNCCVGTGKVQQKLKEFRMHKENDMERRRLNSEEFISLFKEVTTRPEIYFLLVRYSSNADHMSTDDLLLFLEAEQGMTRVTKDKCLDIVEQYEPSKDMRKHGQLGIDGFTGYLLSEECDIFDPEHLTVCQDMTQPLSHYFIAASHNTYLMEDQLRGPSSIEGYTRALKRGCRCVELDCWDGPEEPVIYHGHTLTSKIAFKAVIEAINQYAFATSDFPVILSLENHCGVKQQQLMAQQMKEVFGDKLFTEPLPQENNSQFLPSPDFFKHRILIKCKKIIDSEEGEGYVTDEDEGAETEKTKKNKKEGSMKKRKMSKDLSDLVTVCKSVRFQDFQTSLQKGKAHELCSFSESAAIKLANGCPEEFVNHNKRFLSRIYPNGMRVDSSNYNPQDLWNCGCQLVALNYQTPGLMMDLNHGRFQQNACCGYILKPTIMRDEIAFFSANTKDVIPGVSPQILHVKIISGQQMPKPKGSGSKGDTIDPYVNVEIFGIPADCAEERTKTVQHNGYNPIFDESFEFQINLPELALVRFTVLDDDYIGDEFIGQHSIPFDCMMTGYRHIPLKSNTGDNIQNCSLFVHVAITNKRGGGKASRRGMSVRKNKRHREYTSMKAIGIKSVDETFRLTVQPLRDGTDLRDNVQVALATFKEACGLSTISNLKQCIRMLSSRITSSCDHVTVAMAMKTGYPYLEVQGVLPDSYRKAVITFDQLMVECRTLIERADNVHSRLMHAQQSGLEWHEDLQNIAISVGLKGKKLNKSSENFAWNVRVLRGQADLVKRAKLECEEYVQQVLEASVSLGLMHGHGGNKGLMHEGGHEGLKTSHSEQLSSVEVIGVQDAGDGLAPSVSSPQEADDTFATTNGREGGHLRADVGLSSAAVVRKSPSQTSSEEEGFVVQHGNIDGTAGHTPPATPISSKTFLEEEDLDHTAAQCLPPGGDDSAKHCDTSKADKEEDERQSQVTDNGLPLVANVVLPSGSVMNTSALVEGESNGSVPACGSPVASTALITPCRSSSLSSSEGGSSRPESRS